MKRYEMSKPTIVTTKPKIKKEVNALIKKLNAPRLTVLIWGTDYNHLGFEYDVAIEVSDGDTIEKNLFYKSYKSMAHCSDVIQMDNNVWNTLRKEQNALYNWAHENFKHYPHVFILLGEEMVTV